MAFAQLGPTPYAAPNCTANDANITAVATNTFTLVDQCAVATDIASMEYNVIYTQNASSRYDLVLGVVYNNEVIVQEFFSDVRVGGDNAFQDLDGEADKGDYASVISSDVIVQMQIPCDVDGDGQMDLSPTFNFAMGYNAAQGGSGLPTVINAPKCAISDAVSIPLTTSLTVVKNVINDEGGSSGVGEFGIETTAGPLTFDSGTSNGTTTTYTSEPLVALAPGTYTLTETDLPFYTEGTWSCTEGTVTNSSATGGSIDILSSDNTICTITNDDILFVPAPSNTLDKAAPSYTDVDGSATYNVDDTLAYTITATNDGNMALANVVVSDPLLSPNSISCATVNIGETCVLTGTYTLTQTDIDAGTFSNTAQVVSNEIPTPLTDTEVTTIPQLEGLTIVKPAPANGDEDGSANVSLDDTLTYTITATNSGTTTLNNVVVSDPLISPNTITCVTLAPGANCVLSGDYSVTQTDVDGGSISNTAGVVSDEITTPVEDSFTQAVAQTDALTINKPAPANADEDSSGDISLDDTLTYTITATNSGATTLNNVVVSDPLITPNTITCATLAPGATCVLSGDYSVTQTDVDGGSIVNTAGVVSDEITTPVEDSFNQAVAQADALTIDKPAPANADEDSSGDVSLDDTLTYTITATNSGTTTLNNVVVSDPLITPTTITCATLVPGATCVLSGDYTVSQTDVDAGSIANTAGVASDEITTPVEDSFTQSIAQADALTINKPAPANADEDSSGDVSLDDTLTYTITATNSGTTTLNNVVVSDPLITPTTITCAALLPGATCVLSGDYTVSQTDVDAGSVANTAGVVSDEITTPVEDSFTQTIAQADALTINKPAPANADEDSSGDVSIDDTLTYTITATNSGTTTLNNVIISDPLITPTTITCAVLAPGATCILSGDYLVAQTDVDAGSIDNIAGVVSDEITTPIEDSFTQATGQTDALTIDKPAPANTDEDSSASVSLNDTLTYTITATNSGTTTLNNVVVSDPLITPTTITCATLAPGATCVLSGDYSVTQTDVDNGSIANTAGVVSNEITTPVEDSFTQTVAQADALTIDKPAPANADEDSSGDVSLDDTLTYTVTATNSGTTTLSNVVVSDPLITPTTITCATLAPGATCVLSGDYSVTQTDVDNGSVANTAGVVSDEITTPVEDSFTQPTGQADGLTIDKPAPANADEDSSADVSLDDTLTYTVTATNSGTTTLNNVVVYDPLITPTTITCATLAPGATCVLSGDYAVTQTDVDAGSIANTAGVISDEITTPVEDNFTQSVGQADALTIDKPAPANTDEDGSTDVTLDDTLTYTVTATNSGTTTLNNVIVTDPLITPTTITCATLAPAATCVLSGDYTVTQTDVDAGAIANTAGVVSDEITTPIQDSVTQTIAQTDALTIDKPAPANADEDSSADVSLDDTLTYTVTATNSGTTTLNNVVVSDPLITPTTITCATVAPGAICVLSGDYTVTQTDVDNGLITNTAGVVSDEVTTPIDDSVTQTVGQSDALTLNKPAPANADEDGSGDVSLDDTLTYTVTATNSGTTTLNNVIVSDPLITPNSITCAIVAPGATCVLTGDYTATQTDVDIGSIVNTANVISDEITTPVEDGFTQITGQTDAVVLDKPAPVNADEDGSSDVSLDDTLTYTITATNSGTTTLNNVVVSDPLITPTTITCATVAPGAICALSGDYTVTQTDVDNGSIINTAGVVSDEITAPVEDSYTQVTGQADALALSKPAPVNADEDSSGGVSLNDTLTYTVTATNSGTTTLSNVVVSDPLITPNTITCASLLPGAVCVLTGDYTVTQTDVDAGTIANTAGVVSDEIATPVEDSNTQFVAQSDALSIDKPAPTNGDEDSSGDVSLDDTLTYIITATNTGTTTLNNVVVSDPLITPTTITCATLAPGATCVLSGDYTVSQADVDAGTIANTAGVVSDEVITPVEDVFNQPTGQTDAVTIDKPAPINADEDGSNGVSLNDTLTYTITATNSGTTTLNNVVVSDPLITPTTITCATVAPGAICVLSGDYTVTQTDVDAANINNTAGVVSDEITTPVEDSFAQSVVQTDALTINKPAPANADEDASGDASLNDTLTYTVTATNSGTTTLNNVVVSDPMITPNSLTCATVAPGATCVLSGDYTVTQTDVDAGTILNTAGVFSDEITTPVEDSNSQVTGQADALAISKPAPVNADEDGSGGVSLNDTLTYTVTATNSGTTTLSNVVVSDPLITPNSTTCASLVPGAICVLSGDYTVTQTDVDNGTIVNTAAVVSDEIATPVEDSNTQTVAQADALTLDKPAPTNADEDSSGDVSLDDTLTYTITATNSGSTTLNNVIVSDPIITPTTFTCAVLTPGATCVLSGDYTVTQTDVDAGTIANTAGVVSDEITTPVEDVFNQPTGQTDALAIDKPAPVNADEDNSSDVSLNDTLTYTVTATNTGTTTLNNVVVSDAMITPSSSTCTTLAPGAICVLSGDYTVTQADVDGVDIVNTAGVVSDEITTPVEDSFTQGTGQTDSMTLNKPAPVNADEDGSVDVSLNDTLTYTITATNTGTTTLDNVVVSDPMITPSTVTCAAVAPGATCVLSGDYSVTQTDVDNGSIANNASVVSDEITTPVEDNYTQVTGQADALVLNKPTPMNADEDGSGNVSLNDTLTYTVTAINSGTTTLNNVVITDAMTTPSSFTCATLAPTATCVLSGNYTVTQTDVDAGMINNTASVVSDEITTPVEDSVAQPASQTDALSLNKPAPSNLDEDVTNDVSLNDTLTYTITATNTGTTTLSNVVVSDPLITPNSRTCTVLAPGAICVLAGDYTVTQTDVDTGSIANTASVISDEITNPVVDSITQSVAQPTGLDLAKSAPVNSDEDSSGDVTLGDTLTYTITATNTGVTTQTNVIVSDPLTTPSSVTCASIIPGATCVLSATYNVTQADVDAGSFVNTASVVSDLSPTPTTDSVTQPIAQTNALALDKPAPVNADQDGSGDVSLSDTLTYTITATNTGTTTLNNVIVSDALTTPNSITCAIVAPGAVCVLTANYSVTQADVDAGSIANTAGVVSDEITTPVEDSFTQSVGQVDGLTINKPAPLNTDEDGSGNVSLGDTLTYTVTATNSGTTTLANVVVTDAMITPSALTCASLAPGATCVLSGDYTVTQTDVDAGSIVNTASVVSDEIPTAVNDNNTQATSQSEAMTVNKPAPANADEDGTGDVSIGDTLTYTVTATNTGTTTLNNIIINDVLITPSTNTCATLAPGGTCVLSGTYTVTQADVDTGSIENIAGAVSDEIITPVEDTVSQPVSQATGLALIKPAPVNVDEDGSGTVSVDDTLTYTITATNTGSTTQTDVVVTDALIAPSSNTCPSVIPGGICVLTGNYSVTQADVDAGTITNTASVVSDEITTPVNDSVTQAVTQSAAVDVTKPAPANGDEDGSGDVSLGDTLTYTVTATNTGLTTLTNLVVSDAMITPATQSCPAVAPGATCVLIGDYIATQADVDAGIINNTAGAVSDQIITPIEDSVAQPVGQITTLDLTKPAPTNADQDSSGGVSLGDTLTYVITAMNSGTTTLNNVVVTDAMTTPSTQTCATLAPGGTCILTGSYTVTQADVDAGTVVNTANVVSDEITTPTEDGFTQPVTQTEGLTLNKPAPANADEDGSGGVSFNDTLTYTITATNSGTITLNNVVVTDVLTTPSTRTCAAVAPGATCVLNGEYTVNQADVDAGSFANTASVVSDEITEPVNDNFTQPIIQTQAMTLNKPSPANADEDNTGDVSFGDTLTYTVTATNTGTTTLTNVTVSDALITPSTATCATLAPGRTCVLSGSYVVQQIDVNAGSVFNTASVVSNEIIAPVEDSVDQTVSQRTGLTLVKPAPINNDADNSGDVSLGDTLTYTVTATNTGSVTLTNVVVTDALTTPNSNTCPAVLPGGICVLSGTYVVTQANVDAGTVENNASVVSDQITTPVEAAVSQDVAQISTIGLDKPAPTNADEDNTDSVTIGDTLTYTVTATNTGTVTLNNVVITDPITTPSTASCATLAPGATCVLTGSYVVTLANEDAESVPNTASVVSSEIQTSVQDSFIQFVQQRGRLDVTKSSGRRDVSFGDPVPYEITVTNNDTLPRSGLTYVDIMPTGFSYAPGSARVNGVLTEPLVNGQRLTFTDQSIDAGETVTLNIVLVVGSTVGEGSYINQALVESGFNGVALSEFGEATVMVVPSPVFDCSEIIGKVFDDQNRNGRQELNEPGIPDVRVVTVKGEIITTDEHGRYHIACAAVPNGNIGSNYILKLDPRSLPTGFRITTENPRVVRLTRGKMTKLNFGATKPRVVTLDLSHQAFAPRSELMHHSMEPQIAQLVSVLQETPTILRVNYHSVPGEPAGLTRARLKMVSDHMNNVWETSGCCYELSVETKLLSVGMPTGNMMGGLRR